MATSEITCRGCGKKSVEEMDDELAQIAISVCPLGWVEMSWFEEPMLPSPDSPTMKRFQFCDDCKPSVLAASLEAPHRRPERVPVYIGEFVEVHMPSGVSVNGHALGQDFQDATAALMRLLFKSAPDHERGEIARRFQANMLGNSSMNAAALAELIKDPSGGKGKPS